MERWLVELIDSSDIARFATLGKERPHVVPVVLVTATNHIYLPIDGKRKRPGTLQRVRTVETNPHATLLLDHYEEDWSRLWWVRIEAIASIVPLPTSARLKLTKKYAGYADTELGIESIKLEIVSVHKWSQDPSSQIGSAT